MGEWEREWQARKQPADLTISSEPAHVSALAPGSVEAVSPEADEAEQPRAQESHSQAGQNAPATLVSGSTVASNATGSVELPGTNDYKTPNGPTPDQAETQPPASSGIPIAPTINGIHHSFNSVSNITKAHKPSATAAHTKSSGTKSSRPKVSSSASATTTVLRPTHVHSPMPSNPGGESIYRTIMNRLDMLERNSTLSLRYVEEQNHSVRQALRRLEEDVGRLKALTGQQQQELQRSMKNVEKKQAEMEKRWDALLEQVNTLAEEVWPCLCSTISTCLSQLSRSFLRRDLALLNCVF
jgi:hypothetical protein